MHAISRLTSKRDLASQTILTFEDLRGEDQWVPSAHREFCVVCVSKFSTFRRRHHCRKCGEVVCSSCCVKQRALLPLIGMCKVKVCTPCSSNSRGEGEYVGKIRGSQLSEAVGCALNAHVTQREMSSIEAIFSPTNSNEDDDEEEEEGEEHGGRAKRASPWDVSDYKGEWIPNHELEDVRCLSRGRYENVWLVQYRKSRQVVSKRIVKAKASKGAIASFLDELHIAAELSHPRIVTLEGASWTEQEDLQALYEYLPGGDLRTYLDATAGRQASPQRDFMKLQIALDIAEALVYLHSMSPALPYRRLRSREVLLTTDLRAKLKSIRVPRSDSESSRAIVGMAKDEWTAPEVFLGQEADDTACDIYAFGVILSELDTHRVPFSDCCDGAGKTLSRPAVFSRVIKGEQKPTFSHTCPVGLKQLGYDCLALRPEERPTGIEVVVRLRAFIRANGLDRGSIVPVDGVVLCAT